MKKIICIATTFAVIFTLTTCSPRNTANRNNNNMGINQGSTAGRNISNQTAVFRDGVYTGMGDGHANGNENATVTIRNGRIVGVVLASLDKQGNIIRNSTGIGTSNTTNQNAGIRNTPGNNNASATRDNANNTGNAAGASTLDNLGSRLSAAVLQNQTDNVNLDGIDASFSSTINNWKLAIKRALDQAR